MERKIFIIKFINLVILSFCVFALCFSLGERLNSANAEEPVFFDLLDDAVFDDDVGGRLTYDTETKTGVVNAGETSWINRNFSFVLHENVITENDETKPFNQCSTEFSVTYSDISVLDTQANILGVQLTSGTYSLAYRVQGKLQYGKSSWLALGNDTSSPFVYEGQSGNYRMGTTVLASTTTIKIAVTPKIGDENGVIEFYVNGDYMGSLVYTGEEQLTFGLAAQRNTANISDASYKVLGATGWDLGDEGVKFEVLDGTQFNDAFGYDGATNTGSLTAAAAGFARPFGNMPEFNSVILENGTSVSVSDITWEYSAVFYDFNYINGNNKEEPEDYFGTGLSVIAEDGTELNMRIMYDGRLNVAASNAAVFGLGTYGKNYNIPSFSPKTAPETVSKKITLKYVVNRSTGEISYFVNGLPFGMVTYSGDSELSGFGLNTYRGGAKYKDFSIKMVGVVGVTYPARYEVFNGSETNKTYSYNASEGTAYLAAGDGNRTKRFVNVPVYEEVTLVDGTKAKPKDVIWEFSATLYDFEFGMLPNNYNGTGISLMTSDGKTLNMRIMYDGQMNIATGDLKDAELFGLPSYGKTVNIFNFNPKANIEDCAKEITLKFRVNKAAGEITYFVKGQNIGSLRYFGEAQLSYWALHSYFGGAKYKDISLSMLEVESAVQKEFYSESFNVVSPTDLPKATPNTNYSGVENGGQAMFKPVTFIIIASVTSAVALISVITIVILAIKFKKTNNKED